jgi:hypothetical protein
MEAEPAAMNASDVESAPDLPQVPRQLSARARRRSWAEMPVRVWMVLSIAVGIVTIFFTATRLNEALDDRWLIQHGLDVAAKFTKVDGDPFPKRRPRNESMPVEFTYVVDGKAYNQSVSLEPKHDSKGNAVSAMVGTDFPIKVDPRNPSRWREETELKPWSQELTAIGFLLPLWIVVLAIMFWKRATVLKTWRNEPLAEGFIVEVRHTPIAPMSRIVRFSLRDGPDRRVWSTSMPFSAGIPPVGAPLWLICSPARPGRAIVAKLYA